MLLGILAGRIGDGLQVHPVSEMTALVELLAYLGDALSYSQGTTARLAAQAGGTFSRYAPGDHKRQTAGEGDS